MGVMTIARTYEVSRYQTPHVTTGSSPRPALIGRVRATFGYQRAITVFFRVSATGSPVARGVPSGARALTHLLRACAGVCRLMPPFLVDRLPARADRRQRTPTVTTCVKRTHLMRKRFVSVYASLPPASRLSLLTPCSGSGALSRAQTVAALPDRRSPAGAEQG
jgi:hypothetical protein